MDVVGGVLVTRLTCRVRRSFSRWVTRIRLSFPLPDGVDAKAERLTTKGSIQQYQTTLTLTSIDKQKLGQVAAEMHKLRKPDAYKGKGIRYADVPIKLKPGKTGK